MGTFGYPALSVSCPCPPVCPPLWTEKQIKSLGYLWIMYGFIFKMVVKHTRRLVLLRPQHLNTDHRFTLTGVYTMYHSACPCSSHTLTGIAISFLVTESFNFYLIWNETSSSRCIHHFKSDLINNMDHMRISGTEPSSVILSQTM